MGKCLSVNFWKGVVGLTCLYDLPLGEFNLQSLTDIGLPSNVLLAYTRVRTDLPAWDVSMLR
jgi:hypothetical protein